MAKGLKFSRAVWKGSWYRRKQSSTWRNPNTGEVKSSPSSNSRLNREIKYSHDYGDDRLVSPKKKFDERKKKFIIP